jgi:hypothetical protein
VIWSTLGEADQALRCRVTRLQADGQRAAAAALLEERGLFEAAARAWESAGEPSGLTRCEARRLEQRRRWDEAARRWTSLGETKEAARCQGRHHWVRGEYARAARAFEEAGDPAMALRMRVVGAQLAGDRDGALALARAAGHATAAEVLRDPPAALRVGGRGSPSRGQPAGPTPSPTAPPAAMPRVRPIQTSLFAEGAETPPGIAAAGERPAPSGASSSSGHAAAQPALVIAVVKKHPGLPSREVAALTGLDLQRTQTLLRQAIAGGRVVKTGATRGTRYWPAETRDG